jgi:hypothetical protein
MIAGMSLSRRYAAVVSDARVVWSFVLHSPYFRTVGDGWHRYKGRGGDCCRPAHRIPDEAELSSRLVARWGFQPLVPALTSYLDWRAMPSYRQRATVREAGIAGLAIALASIALVLVLVTYVFGLLHRVVVEYVHDADATFVTDRA